MRTLQYFSRFYAWYLLRTNASALEVLPYETMKKTFGSIRKGLRLGKFVEHYKAAAVAYDAPASVDPVLRVCAVGRQVGYAGYLTCDNLAFLDTLGVRKMEARTTKMLGEYAYKCWLVGLSFNAVAGLYQLWALGQRSAAVDKKDGEGVVESKKLERFVWLLRSFAPWGCANEGCRERSGVTRQLISDLCDITVPSFGLGYAPFLDDGIVGLAGTVSSLIGLQKAWENTA